LFLIQSSVCAHPPSEVVLAYDSTSGVLSVTVKHNTDDITLHYIEQLDILVNGGLLDITHQLWEENETGLVATYNVSALDGDKIEVEARCSIQGSKLGSIIVGATDDGEGTPGFEMVFVVGIILVFCLVRRRLYSKN
jgi:hypothetical protein